MKPLPTPVGIFREIYTVSRLNREAKALLEDGFPALWIEGEISNLARPSSGHLYFCLKDASGQVRCALFRNQARAASVVPRDGMHVLARARVSLYEGRGEFQLIIDHIEDSGEGALRRAFEALKLRLGQEGLFDEAHKKSLPALPRRIGIVTSPTGAAVRDIITTLRRRFPAIPLLLYPVPVQGDGAAEKIAAAVHLASERQDCDALILARGGGSLEDLWAFNEEIVARAIFACRLPVVAGVGHETDVTIADLVADVRAPTPTAAAELLSPSREAWRARFEHYAVRLVRLAERKVRDASQRLDWLAGRLVRPDKKLIAIGQRLDATRKRLTLAAASTVRVRAHAMTTQRIRLRALSPAARLLHLQRRVTDAGRRLRAATERTASTGTGRLEAAAGRLQALSPLATLGRGYAIVRRRDNNAVVRDVTEVQPGEHVIARVARGTLTCLIERKDDETDA